MRAAGNPHGVGGGLVDDEQVEVASPCENAGALRTTDTHIPSAGEHALPPSGGAQTSCTCRRDVCSSTNTRGSSCAPIALPHPRHCARKQCQAPTCIRCACACGYLSCVWCIAMLGTAVTDKDDISANMHMDELGRETDSAVCCCCCYCCWRVVDLLRAARGAALCVDRMREGRRGHGRDGGQDGYGCVSQ